MMMSLGMFVFELPSLTFQELNRDTSWRHAQNSRVGARPSNQFLGPGDDTLQLSGSLLPDIAGDPRALDTLRQMADEGQAWPLVDGLGGSHGAWVIERVSDNRSNFFKDGVARRYDFSIGLRHVDDPAQATSGGKAGGGGANG